MFALLSFVLHKQVKRALAHPTHANSTPSHPPTSSSTDTDSLADFICASPLLHTCGISREQILEQVQQWADLGNQVIANLGLPPLDSLSEAQKSRIFQYYLPVFAWCQEQLRRHRASGSSRTPLVLGISAPQGCGKTTLCEQLEALFSAAGCTAASLSIDDFYLTYQEQQAVAAAHPDNPLLQMRGNAGSHDVQLGTDTLAALKAAGAAGGSVALPRYDKSAYSGRGDRAPSSTWPTVHGPVDIVLLEGWMLGFAALKEEEVVAVDPHLTPVNAALRRYRDAWDAWVDAWLVVRVAQPDYAYKWRLQAERAMRASGRPAMTDEQVAAFVDRFMPAYLAYLPGLYRHGPTTARPGRLLVVEVDEQRAPVQQQAAAIM